MTVGIVNARGNVRDQFVRAATSAYHERRDRQHHACSERRMTLIVYAAYSSLLQACSVLLDEHAPAG